VFQFESTFKLGILMPQTLSYL